MFAFRFLVATFVALVAASSAQAADRYYVAPGTGDGAILYDRPLSVALARCYGLVDGTVRAVHAKKATVPADLSDTLIALGGALADVAKKDRGLDIRIDTFRPAEADDQGIPEDTGAPGTLYPFYDDGETTAERSEASIDLQPCEGLLADIKANRNVGAPRERLYLRDSKTEIFLGHEPMVLALAYCAGQIFTSDWDSGYLDANELSHDRTRLAAALIASAKRDRGLILTRSDIEKGTMPPALQDMYGRGDDSLSVQAGRPDFQDVADQEYPGVWEGCQKIIEAAAR